MVGEANNGDRTLLGGFVGDNRVVVALYLLVGESFVGRVLCGYGGRGLRNTCTRRRGGRMWAAVTMRVYNRLCLLSVHDATIPLSLFLFLFTLPSTYIPKLPRHHLTHLRVPSHRTSIIFII